MNRDATPPEKITRDLHRVLEGIADKDENPLQSLGLNSIVVATQLIIMTNGLNQQN